MAFSLLWMKFDLVLRVNDRERPRIRLSTLDLSEMASLPDGSFGREYLRFLEDNVSVHVQTDYIKINKFTKKFLPFTFPIRLHSSIRFPVLSGCDPRLKGKCKVCGRWRASLRHAEIQRGPWFAAHLTGHAHQHVGWVRLYKLKSYLAIVWISTHLTVNFLLVFSASFIWNNLDISFSFRPFLLLSGEVAVKWFEAAQTGLPMCALGAVLGPLRLSTRYNTRV